MKREMAMTKPTMQDLAEATGVSRVTVWKALTNRPGVSQEVRQAVRQRAEEMGVLPEQAERAAGRERTFSVVVSRPESSMFWMQIIHHIAKELTRNGISLLYTYMPTAWRKGYVLPASLQPDSVDGFIVLNVYDDNLLRLLAGQGVPKVFLDTVPGLRPPELSGDLVILEGRSRVREITRRLLETGHRRLGFLGDVAYAQTNTDRYQGFLDAHEELGLACDPAFSLTSPLSLRSHYEEISRFLDGLPVLPDGFVCASDFIAHFVHRYLQESDREPRERFVLTGFDNNLEYANVAEQITTVGVETAALGQRLARMLMFRADYPDAPYEVTYVGTDVIYRGDLARAGRNGHS